METLRFASNIKCDGCISKVTPHLNASVGADNWEVDLTTPNKVLTVVGNATEEQVREAVQKAGYKVEKIACVRQFEEGVTGTDGRMETSAFFLFSLY